jgi:hypothetical protein
MSYSSNLEMSSFLHEITARLTAGKAGRHKAKHTKQPITHTGCLRQSHFGELVQIDGSPHRLCSIEFSQYSPSLKNEINRILISMQYISER